MKSIKISIAPIRDGEVVSGVYMKQRFRNGTWLNEESITVVSDQPGNERTLLLDNDQRLVIEGKSNKKMIYDKDQATAREVEDNTLPTPASPVDSDGDESPRKPAVDRAMEPKAMSEAEAEERRQAALTAARQKLKEAPKEGLGKHEGGPSHEANKPVQEKPAEAKPVQEKPAEVKPIPKPPFGRS